MAAFVVWRNHVLLHLHPKLGIWLPPGGHIEPHELPDDAAIREVREETGIAVRLVGEYGVRAPGPRALVRPEGIQVESIRPDHEHIDLVYFAVPIADPTPRVLTDRVGWYGQDEFDRMGVLAEIRAWSALAIETIAKRTAALLD